MDARRRAIQNAPQVLFRNEPPLELQNVQNLGNERDDKVGYVTFGNPAKSTNTLLSLLLHHIVLFPMHLTPQRRQETISHIQTFRDYFHYHIKASKV